MSDGYWCYTTATNAATFGVTNAFTFDVTNASNSTMTFYVAKPRAPAPDDPQMTTKPPPAPKPERSRFREGDAVRVLSEGILHRRTGTVSGFLDTAAGVVVFVSWPGGGWTTFKDESLELAKPRKPAP